MINKINPQFGCSLYSTRSYNLFYPLLERMRGNNEIFTCPIAGEPLITTIFWLQSTTDAHVRLTVNKRDEE